MPDLRPFAGIRYTQAAGEPAGLMAPPYDVIDPTQHVELCRRDAHNIVRLILGDRRSPHEPMPDDWHDDAARRFEAWQADGVLATDSEPAFYVYTQAFEHEGQQHTRKLLLGALKLEPYGSGHVLPHENTLPGPKADRLRLMQACAANLSPILTFFPDSDGRINALLDTLLSIEPVQRFADDTGIRHEFRCVTDPVATQALTECLAPLPLYIADGHHRYETALAYQHLRRASHNPDIETPADFCLAACMSAADPGMVIRACHRVVSWADGPDPAEILEAAAAWFDIERLGGASINDVLAAMRRRTSPGCFTVYAGRSQGYALLTLRDERALANSPHPPSSPIRLLSAAVFAHGFIEPLLRGHGPRVAHTPDAAEVVRRVDSGAARLAGLLPAVRPSELTAAVDAGERMPPKSTYFWPKPLTGLVMRSLRSG